MKYGKSTSDSQLNDTHILKPMKNLQFLKITFFTLRISLILPTTLLTAVLILLNYYIRYVLIQIFPKIKEMAAVSTLIATVQLSKIDSVPLNATHQTMESIHLHLFKKKQIKISLI